MNQVLVTREHVVRTSINLSTRRPMSNVLMGFAEALSAPEAVWSLVDAGFQVRAFARRGSRSALRHSRHVQVFDVPRRKLTVQRQFGTLKACSRLPRTTGPRRRQCCFRWTMRQCGSAVESQMIGHSFWQGRVAALDWLKGALVVFMVIYHSLNYSGDYTGAAFRLMAFPHPSMGDPAQSFILMALVTLVVTLAGTVIVERLRQTAKTFDLTYKWVFA